MNVFKRYHEQEEIFFDFTLASKRIAHAFTHASTPEQNAFVAAFHSIIQNPFCEQLNSIQSRKQVKNLIGL